MYIIPSEISSETKIYKNISKNTDLMEPVRIMSDY